MTTPLSDEEEKRYTHLIDAILETADLLTVTRKKVRKGLEKALGGKDLSDQKDAIKALIEARFDAINSQSLSTPPLQQNDDGGSTPSKRDHSAISGGYDDDGGDADSHGGSFRTATEDSEIRVVALGDETPAKKKHKRSSSSVEDADARLAAELQAQENRLARARTTRGGGVAAKPRKKVTKKKSAAKVKGEDSDVDHSDASGNKEKRKAGGGFQKPFNLSYQLGELVGCTQLSRPQVVKKLWEHIKSNELQDPSDRRQICCDEKMQAVFKQQKVDMFQMNKLLGNHLYPVDEE